MPKLKKPKPEILMFSQQETESQETYFKHPAASMPHAFPPLCSLPSSKDPLLLTFSHSLSPAPAGLSLPSFIVSCGFT